MPSNRLPGAAVKHEGSSGLRLPFRGLRQAISGRRSDPTGEPEALGRYRTASPEPGRAKAYRLETAHGTSLFIDKHRGDLVHALAARDDLLPVTAFTVSAIENAIFLNTTDPTCKRININDQFWIGRTIAYKIRRSGSGERFALVDPRTGKFASAQPIDPGKTVGELHVNRPEAGEWEHYTPVPLGSAETHVPTPLQQLVALSRPGDTLWSIMERCLGDPASYDVLQVIGRLAGDSECKGLAAALMRRPELAQVFAGSPPEGLWAGHSIPMLLKWLDEGRRPSDVDFIDTDLDPIAELRWNVPCGSVAASCNAAMRRLVLPRRRLAILTSARNEGPYLVDFIAYHRAIGFEQIFIYTNDNTDGSDWLLESLAHANLIRLIRNKVAPGTSPQYKAYNHCMEVIPDGLDFEWMAAIDIDEYIRYDEAAFDTFEAYVVWQTALNVDSIQLPWATHGPNDHRWWKDTSVLERFSERLVQRERSVKCIFRPNVFQQNAIHFPLERYGNTAIYRRDDGQLTIPTGDREDCLYDHAWVSHFYYKSLLEYVARRVHSRGDVTVSHHVNLDILATRHVEQIVRRYPQATTQTAGISAPLASQVAAERKRIIDLPNIAEAHEQCCRMFMQNALNILQQLRASPRFQAEGSSENTLLNLLQSGLESDHFV